MTEYCELKEFGNKVYNIALDNVEKKIDWYDKDLLEHIAKTHDTEKAMMTDGQLAREVMGKGRLLLKRIKQDLKKMRK